MTQKQSTLSTYFRYLIPSMLGMALVAVYTFTDTFVVGRELGPVALGAMGVCTPILTTTYAIGFLFGMGGGALYSISNGKKDAQEANRFYTTSLFAMLALGMLLAVLGNIFAEPLAYFLGAKEENIICVMPYLRCIVSCIPGFMFDVFIMTYMKNAGHPNTAFAATSTGTGLNVVLDLLFVFVFKWGMFGAAIATCIGSAVCSIINIVWIAMKKLDLVPHTSAFLAGYVPKILRTGFSVFILECSSGIVTFVFIMQANSFYGAEGASVYTIIMNWTLICFNLMMGIAQSVQPLISISHGAGNAAKVRAYRKYAIVSSLIAGIIFIVLGYSITEPLISVFSDQDMGLVALASDCFRLYLPAYFIMGIGISIGIYFQAMGKAAKSLVVMLARGIVLPVAFAFLLPLMFDKAGLWIAVPAAELCASVTAVIFLLSERKQVPEAAPANAAKPSDHLVITISREFGSGGREIGKAVAAILGIPCYDKEVPELAAAESGFSDDRENSGASGAVINNVHTEVSSQIYQAQNRVIRSLADKGSCVIIGRCADHVLYGRCRTFNVFVHAPLEMRVKRVVEYDKCTEKQAVERITANDRSRADYHDLFTGTKWGDTLNYDLTLNSRMGTQRAAEVICACAAGTEKV